MVVLCVQNENSQDFIMYLAVRMRRVPCGLLSVIQSIGFGLYLVEQMCRVQLWPVVSNSIY